MRGMRRYHGRGRVGPGGGEHFEEGYDDFGDELRAFTRKREIEKEERKWKERRRRHSSYDSLTIYVHMSTVYFSVVTITILCTIGQKM